MNDNSKLFEEELNILIKTIIRNLDIKILFYQVIEPTRVAHVYRTGSTRILSTIFLETENIIL